MRIMPSGNGAFDWVPGKPGLRKEASSKDGTVQENGYRDDLFEAAKKVVANYECASDFGGDEFSEAPASEEFETDAVEFEADVVNEVSEESGESAVVEGLEKAVDAIQDAVKELGGGTDDGNKDFETEVDLEVEDENFETEVDLEDEDEVVEGESDLDVEAIKDDDDKKCDVCEECECDPCECDEIVEAKSSDWVKVAEISPQNRKKIMDYWANKLGYPKDFVKLMVKDYEK